MSEFERCVAALVRYRAEFESFTRPATSLLLESLRESDHAVLDLGAGIGDPSLAFAEALDRGRVTAVDRVPDFLAALTTEAGRRGRGRGIEVVAADFQQLPFADASFDFAVSRLGIQFAADALAACREMKRVLRDSGHVRIVAWGSPEQPLLALGVSRIFHELRVPIPFAVGTPGPFRFSAPGALPALLAQAGFVEIESGALRTGFRWPGSAESFWQAMLETSAPLFEPQLSALSPEEQARLSNETVTALREFESKSERALTLPAELHWAGAKVSRQ